MPIVANTVFLLDFSFWRFIINSRTATTDVLEGEIMDNVIFENVTNSYFIVQENILYPEPHLHKEIEIVYVIDGYAMAFCDNSQYPISTGDLFITFPNQVHYYENATVGKYLLIIIAPEVIYGLKDIFYDNIPQSNAVRLNEYLIFDLFQKSYYASGKYEATMFAGYINQAMALVMDKLPLKPRLKTNNLTLQKILFYCEENFRSNITLEQVANDLNLSKYHISHLLNEKLNLTFVEYMNIIKINYACNLLESTDLSVLDISEASGFGSLRTFNRVFQSQKNTTPVKYRKDLSDKTSFKDKKKFKGEYNPHKPSKKRNKPTVKGS